jgi:signal transduction histidine kinase
MKSLHTRREMNGRALSRIVFGFLLALTARSLPAAAPARATVQSSNVDRSAGAWRVTSWTTDDALPQGSVYAIHQTRDGYLWFATLGGLVRYDGLEFTTFERATTPGLRSNRFTTLLEDGDGSLWAGTEDGFLTRYRDGTFLTQSVDGSFAPIYAISLESSATPWVVTASGTFVIQHPQTAGGSKRGGPWIVARRGGPVRSLRFRYTIGPAAVDERGVLLLSARQPERRIVFAGLLDRGSKAIVTSDGRSLFLVDDARGIFRLNTGTLQPVEQPRLLAVIREAAPMKATDALGALAQTRDGAYWLAVASRGLARIEGDTVEWITEADGLRSRDVSRIYEDREGTLWIATYSGGVSSIRRRAARTYGEAEGLKPPIAYPILATSALAGSGDPAAADVDVPPPSDAGPPGLLVGTLNGGVYRFVAGHFEQWRLNTGWIMSLAAGGGAVWAGTHQGGAIRFRGDTTAVFTTGNGLPSNIVPAIFRAADGRLFFGTADGLSVMTSNEGFVTYRFTSALRRNFIQTIAEERGGGLLLGTRGGLVRFRDGHLSLVADESSGLSSESIRAIHIDPDGTIWLGTYDGGLDRLRDGAIRIVTTRQGLYDNGVFAIVEDRGFFWMSSNRGIHRASREELNAVADGRLQVLSPLVLTRGDGLLSSECNGGMQPAAARTSDGLLWFPTQGGIVSVDPRLVPANLPLSSILITGVTIDGKRVASGLQEAVVKPDDKRVEVRFAAPTTFEARRVRYRYRLQGLDTSWNEILGERAVSYTSIPPGRYRFLVSASNGAGRWTEPASFPLRVLPPFWRTGWFVTAAILTLAFLLGSAYRLRVATIERKQREQVEFSRRLLTEQEAERKRLAGELHDGLGQNLLIIRNRALLGLDRQSHAAANEQLEEISTTASSSIDEVRRIAHNLRPVELDHLGLTQSLAVMLRRMTASSNILFSGELEPVDGLLSRDAEVHVFRVVQEWLSNVERHSGASAAVVTLGPHGGMLLLRIRDDGTGFTQAKADRNGRMGIGLRSIAERVQMLEGTYDIQSREGEGTAMTIEFPVRKEA